MKQVAKMLGVELGEEFRVEGFDDKFMLTPNGMFYYDEEDKKWEVSLMIYDILNGTREIVKPILDEKEKEYLSAVVKPFRDEVKHISKNRYDGEEWIQIRTKSGLALLPPFKEGLMYNSMEAGKEYSVKELDI